MRVLFEIVHIALLAGSFQPGSAGRLCLACGPGTHSNRSASTTCTPCQPGSFLASTGGTACVSCQLGLFSASPGAAFCQACPFGQQPSPDRTRCTAPACVVRYVLYCHELCRCLPGFGLDQRAQCSECSPGLSVVCRSVFDIFAAQVVSLLEAASRARNVPTTPTTWPTRLRHVYSALMWGLRAPMDCRFRSVASGPSKRALAPT